MKLNYEFLCYLRTVLRLDPESGVFYWLEREGNRCWNSRYAGEEIGSNDKDGYRVLLIKYQGKKRSIKLHRLAWAFHNDTIPVGEIDHINHSRSDNRPSNLRLVDRGENTKNISWNTRNTSGFLGVSRGNRPGLPWRARLRHNKKEVVIGHFATPEEANAALIAARSRYGYHVNHGDAS